MLVRTEESSNQLLLGRTPIRGSHKRNQSRRIWLTPQQDPVVAGDHGGIVFIRVQDGVRDTPKGPSLFHLLDKVRVPARIRLTVQAESVEILDLVSKNGTCWNMPVLQQFEEWLPKALPA